MVRVSFFTTFPKSKYNHRNVMDYLNSVLIGSKLSSKLYQQKCEMHIMSVKCLLVQNPFCTAVKYLYLYLLCLFDVVWMFYLGPLGLIFERLTRNALGCSVWNQHFINNCYTVSLRSEISQRKFSNLIKRQLVS